MPLFMQPPVNRHSDRIQPAVLGERTRLRVDGKFFNHSSKRILIRGVTYGPFQPATPNGPPFPSPDVVKADIRQMAGIGLNAVRNYHVPPWWLLEIVAEVPGFGVLVDIPWAKHLCFLDSRSAQREARHAIRRAVESCRDQAVVWAYSIGNEIPPDIVRWHGAARIERFLGELADVAKQADPQALITYANYPPTEYLDLSFLDFVTFNVYLHDPETFRRYLFRLQNLVGNRPLVLGEIGMDTLRHGELRQAEFLGGHVREAILAGVAGTFVFSWTDEWYTGGCAIEDWAFGITDANRLPKAACYGLQEVLEPPAYELLATKPKVSVLVCSYNGGQTLRQCLRSLCELDYLDYEVIVIDDGSTDDTPSILADFPTIKSFRQQNQGLSVARNVALSLATGSIVAYTDSDCYVDPAWITHLVDQLESSGAAAVGGPNFTPDDGRIAACVAAAPGQPTHVLESDQVAEHIPGCNMAFRREALQQINGFDPQYRKAGDDVDVCWRLQQAGYWITFAPAAFVWHHRRQTPRTYLKQQAGYGEAEALLRFKHPDRFDGRGRGKWRGQLYGNALQGLVLDQPIIYRGTFGTGMFQCIYQPGPAHWAMLPSTFEWHIVALALVLLGTLWWPLAAAALSMLLLSFVVAGWQALQARLEPKYDGWLSRMLVAWLCYAQPLVRAWWRYRTRYFGFAPHGGAALPKPRLRRRWSRSTSIVAYWGQHTGDRLGLLRRLTADLAGRCCGISIDTGWSDSDVEVFTDPWIVVEVRTTQEEHGQGRRLIRVRYRVRLSRSANVVVAAGFAACLLGATFDWTTAACALLGLIVFLAIVWWRGSGLKASMAMVVDHLAGELSLIRLTTRHESEKRSDYEQATPLSRPVELRGQTARNVAATESMRQGCATECPPMENCAEDPQSEASPRDRMLHPSARVR